jgi:hypothetical protein
MSRGLDWGGEGGVGLVIECPLAENAGKCVCVFVSVCVCGLVVLFIHFYYVAAVTHLHRIGRTARAGEHLCMFFAPNFCLLAREY